MSPDPAAFRAEVRDWLRARVPAAPLPSVDTAEGFARHREWERELAAARLSVVSWPPEYGGRGASLLEWLVFEEEYHAAGAPVRVGQNGLFLLAPALMRHGTAEQRDRLLPPMARADQVWAQAWSEPEAGSDLAAVRASATRTEGGWVLSGTKTWSSRAA
ncbi:MAG TPA: acyl-CoA dehydrogenase family protein, partial [Streptosporangiaceae bacterium]|nr:acyl-CoA dehydrogenase family protein [Streptosporangiaceae bacterium]